MVSANAKRIPQLIQDGLAGLFLISGLISPRLGRGDWVITEWTLLIGFALVATIFLRRKWPVMALLIATVLSIWLMILGVSGPATGVAPAFCLFSAGLALSTKRFALFALMTVISLMGSFVLLTSFDFYDPGWFAFGALQVIAIATSFAARSRRENVELLELRAKQAEESKESEARSRVDAERLRIARDLHDLIGHQLAATSLHAELAERLLVKDPTAAIESVAAIKDSARQSLGELALMLKVLRNSDNLETMASMENLETLIVNHKNYGLEVVEVFEGDLNDLQASMQLVVFRSLQEALTNAGKHAEPKSVNLRIVRTSDSLLIFAQNRYRQSDTRQSAGGYGLIGLRERVGAIGGEVRVTQREGLFELSIELPLGKGA